MARYIGPKARIARRLGTQIWDTKGERSARDKRPYPPGEHGRTRRRGTQSEYLVQLQEKQKARYIYGLSEKQFRRVYQEAHRRPASPARTCSSSWSCAWTMWCFGPAGLPPVCKLASS